MRGLVVFAILAVAAPAYAQPPAQRTARTAAPPKRPMPIYDGRPSPETSAGDVARGIGRVLLFPVYGIVNYGLRAPTGYVVSSLEHSRTAREVFRFVFGPPSTSIAMYPIAFYDFGFQSSLGLRMAWTKGFATPGSSFALKLASGGANWGRADSSVRLKLPFETHASADVGLRRRPDQVFYGIGARTPEDAGSRYTLSRASMQLGVGYRAITMFAAAATVSATESTFGENRSIEQSVASGAIAELPAGYDDILYVERVGAKLALDTRGKQRMQSGARLDVMVERVRERELGAWMHAEATLGGALRLDTVGEYKLDVRVRAELVRPDEGAHVPFFELASIGGSRDLRGFAGGRGRDASAVALMVDYQWPIAAWLDATLYMGVGNVFGPNLSGFYAGTLRGSIGTGLALANLAPDRQVELWTALGTDPFDDGFRFSSFRLVLGYSYDY